MWETKANNKVSAMKCPRCGKITYGKWRAYGNLYCYNCYKKVLKIEWEKKL